MSTPVERQVGEELVARLRAVTLLEPAVARQALADVRPAAHRWGQELDAVPADREQAQDVFDALWPDQPPVAWWGTPLGRCLAAAGVDPGDGVSQRAAADLLGWSRHRVAEELGAAPIPIRSVLDQL